jgi:hypothetical protein
MASAAEEAPERGEWPRYAKPGGATAPTSARVEATQPDMERVMGFPSPGSW